MVLHGRLRLHELENLRCMRSTILNLPLISPLPPHLPHLTPFFPLVPLLLTAVARLCEVLIVRVGCIQLN
jgi:hypothetical protein